MTMENKKIQIRNSTTDFLVFTMQSEEDGIDVLVYDENVWLTQKSMTKLFDVGIPAIRKHLKSIFEARELDEKVVISILEITTKHGAIDEKHKQQMLSFTV